jgi:hypothetical protein
MRGASINRARILCLGILLAAFVAWGLGVGSKSEAGTTGPRAALATLETITGQPEIYFVPDVATSATKSFP